MNSVLSNIGLLVRSTRRSLLYGSMALITVALEELFEKVVFKCPCNGHFAYGLAFLWTPSLFLFLCGILLDRDIWKTKRKETKTKKRAKERIEKYCRRVLLTLEVIVRCALAPASWLVLSLLQTQYYTCAFFGPPLDSNLSAASVNTTSGCQVELGIRTKELEEMYKTRSHMAGWSIMLLAVSVLFVSLFIRRYNKQRKQLRIPSVQYYGHVVAKEALKQFHEKAKEIAREKAKEDIVLFFQAAKNNDFLSRVQEVGATINKKYAGFFVIPPESPAYSTPEAGQAPFFPGELMSDGPEVSTPDIHLRRVALLREGSIEIV